MFHYESWKIIYFGVKRSNVRSHKSTAGVGLCALVSAGFLQLTVRLYAKIKYHVQLAFPTLSS